MSGTATKVESCGYCQGVLDASTQVAECSTCGIKQHRECWDEYGGCVLPGCTGYDRNRPVPTEQPTTQITIDDAGEPVTVPLAPPNAEPVPTSRGSIAVLVVAGLILLAAVIAAGLLFVLQSN